MKMLRRIRIYLVFYENEYNCSEICILLRMQRIRKGIFMLQMLYPDEYLDSTYTIDFKKLYKDGYRGILFDIDNTLVPHGAPADKRAVALFKKLREIGFQTCLISNNKEPRVKSFCDKVGSTYVFKAGKPLPGGYEEGIRRMKTTKENTLFIGDQIFTDILGANLAGMPSFLVEPFQMEPFLRFRLKRFLEKGILKRYRKKERRKNL